MTQSKCQGVGLRAAGAAARLTARAVRLASTGFRASLVLTSLCSGAATLCPAARADEIRPAVVYDGSKFDKSFFEAMYDGTREFTKRTGTKVRDLEVTSEAQREQFLHEFAAKGFNPVLATSFAMADPLSRVAKEFPATHFAIIDVVVDQPNVESVIFREHEGSFLVGMLAAMKTRTGKIGFVGGMDIPLIHKFECGYAQGAKFVNPKVEILQNMTGTTPTAWNDPARGGELAKTQIEQGADIIYAAAGGTGIGVYQAAADAGKLAIGVNSNQDSLQPGHMLTSMLKRVDIATDKIFSDAKNGDWKPGVRILGLADDGVGYSLDEYNEKLITPEMRAKAEDARKAIIAGTIKIHDYVTDNACPV